MHNKLLSQAAPSMMDFAARFMQAVSSTTTGGLPGPAQMARLPACIAAFTTAGPPVTQINLTDSWLQMALKESNVGSSTIVIRFSMPTSRAMARLYSRTATAAQLAAAGWALKTTPLPAATMLMMLPLRVGTECVEGVMAATTPKGVYSSSVIP